MHRALALCLLALFALGCASRGKPKARTGTLLRDQVLVHGGESRRYHLYVPAGAEGPRPLVLLLHGGGGTIDNHVGLGNTPWPHQVWLDLADEEQLLVLVPQGLDNHWNDCRANCARCGEHDDLGFLLALLDDVATRQSVDASRVYVTGESNGGFMTERLAQEAPQRFAAVGVVIALMPSENECTPLTVPMPVMYQVGTSDDLIPFDGGASDSSISVLSSTRSLELWRTLNGCEAMPTTRRYPDLDPTDSSTVRRDDYACATTGAALSFLTIEGGGHVAPSTTVRVTSFWEGLAGIQNHDIEGARELWEFFKGRTRP